MTRCLVIDDSRVLRRLHRQLLDRLGIECIEADNGAAALDACRQVMPDVILVDWNMPRMDGLEFLQALRRLPGGTAPKAIVCSIENDLDHIKRAINAGADDYLMKPFDLDMLTSKLSAAGVCLSAVELSDQP